MANLTECFIILDHQTVYSGNNLTGQVFVDFKVPTEIRNLCIELEGKAHCEWTESESSDKKVTYTGDETLLEAKQFVIGDAINQSPIFYPTGQFSFPFFFTLPASLPSSFEDSYGHIRYELSATIDKGINYEPIAKQSVTLLESIDTNHPDYCKVTGGSVSKSVGCCCFPSGILSLNGNASFSAYCSGEAIYVNAIVQNNSTTDMRSLKAKLTKTVEYKAQNRSGTKSEKTIISKIAAPQIPRGQTRMFSNHQLVIQSAIPSILNCKIIKVSYMLMIYVDVPYGVDLDLELPIVIGTIPRGNNAMMPDAGMSGSLPTTSGPAPSAPVMDPSFFEPALDSKVRLLDSEMAPPSYESVCGINQQQPQQKFETKE